MNQKKGGCLLCSLLTSPEPRKSVVCRSCVSTIVALNELWVFEQRPQFSKSAFWDSQKLCQSLTQSAHCIDSFGVQNEQIHSKNYLIANSLKLYRKLCKSYGTKIEKYRYYKENQVEKWKKLHILDSNLPSGKASSYVITVDANESFCVVNAASAATAIQKRD